MPLASFTIQLWKTIANFASRAHEIVRLELCRVDGRYSSSVLAHTSATAVKIISSKVRQEVLAYRRSA